jgi:uncharacterized protein (DUF2344 family)
VFSRWRFTLSAHFAKEHFSKADWEGAIAEMLREDELIWEDTDKKGRPRRRDVRTLLKTLRLVSSDAADSSSSAQLELIAAVDEQGRSLKPAQLCQWLSERLDDELTLSQVRRMELGLLQC